MEYQLRNVLLVCQLSPKENTLAEFLQAEYHKLIKHATQMPLISGLIII